VCGINTTKFIRQSDSKPEGKLLLERPTGKLNGNRMDLKDVDLR
jgi:hypothetical protein